MVPHFLDSVCPHVLASLQPGAMPSRFRESAHPGSAGDKPPRYFGETAPPFGDSPVPKNADARRRPPQSSFVWPGTYTGYWPFGPGFTGGSMSTEHASGFGG